MQTNQTAACRMDQSGLPIPRPSYFRGVPCILPLLQQFYNSASRCFPVLPGASRSSRRASRWRGGAACFIRRRMRRMQPWRIVPRRSMRGGRTGPADRAGFLKYIYSTIVKLSRTIILKYYQSRQKAKYTSTRIFLVISAKSTFV